MASTTVDMTGAPNSMASTPSYTPNSNQSPRDEPMSVVPESTSTRFVWFVSMLQCIASLQFGYNTAIVSGAMGPLSDHYGIASKEATSSEASDDGNAVMKSIVVSATLVGCLISALVSGSIADRVGRNKVILASEIIYAVGALVCAFSAHIWMLVAGRFILGLAVGIASVVVPLMIGELAPKSIRGQIGVLNQLSITAGILAAYVLGVVFVYIPRVNWRVMMGAPTVLMSAAHLVLTGFVIRTESPRWLVMVKRNDEARSMLQYLRNSDDVEAELADIVASQSQEKSPSLREAAAMLVDPVRPLVIVVAVMFIQQITGINAVLYYLKTFLERAGMESDMAGYMSILIGGINVIMTLVSITLIERLGRKPLLLASLVGMALSLMCIGVFSHVHTLSKSSAGVGSVVFTILYVIFFAIGLGPVPWCLVPELFPSATRALAVSIALFVNWGSNLGVSLAFLPLIEATSLSAVFWGFAVLSGISTIFVALILPETKGRTVEEIVSSMKK
eukprot:m51a1_g9932 hypothetical protein (505) ;mRNA; r:56713-58757